ncbi:MAG: hypothetical protein KAH01_07545 [Caldisericia bacterium]|nr:hypothetical protein [Caldisericia bacterium]
MKTSVFQCVIIMLITLFTSKVYSEENDNLKPSKDDTVKLQMESWKRAQSVNSHKSEEEIGENEIVASLYNLYNHIQKTIYQKGPGIYGYFMLSDKNWQKTRLGIKVPESRLNELVKFTITGHGIKYKLPVKFIKWLRRPQNPYLSDRLYGVDGFYGFVIPSDTLRKRPCRC